MTRKEALSRVPFLRRVPEEVRVAIGTAGHERHYSDGEQLFAEKTPCLGLLIVVTGSVRVFKQDARGREMTLSLERPGNSILDLALFDGGNYPASARADENETSVYVVSLTSFQRLLIQHPEITTAAVRHLAIQMRKLIEMLKVQALHTVRSRLATYLLNTAGSERSFPLRETNEAIGSHVGTVREVVSRTLSVFESDGLIVRQGRRITIIDTLRLRHIATGEGIPARLSLTEDDGNLLDTHNSR